MLCPIRPTQRSLAGRVHTLAFAFGMAAISLSSAGAAAADGDLEPTQRVVSFSGIDFAEDAFAYYSGAIVALNGDLSRDGFVARIIGLSSDFEYDEESVPGGQVDADETQIDVMIGYQKTFGHVTATGYIGYDFRDIELSPDDPGNEVQGSESGFKVAFDAETSDEIPLFVSASGAYSTAFDYYDAMLRLGYNAGKWVVGAEGLASGIEDDDSQRVGGFVTFRFNLTPAMPAELTLNAGHQFVEDDDDTADGFSSTSGGEGAYGGASFAFSF